MNDKPYVTPEELANVLPLREKAVRHLRTWTKKALIQHLAMASKEGWIEKWAHEYDMTAIKEGDS